MHPRLYIISRCLTYNLIYSPHSSLHQPFVQLFVWIPLFSLPLEKMLPVQVVCILWIVVSATSPGNFLCFWQKHIISSSITPIILHQSSMLLSVLNFAWFWTIYDLSFWFGLNYDGLLYLWMYSAWIVVAVSLSTNLYIFVE